MREKIKGREELREIVERLKGEGQRVVFTNGCFDLLHIGHVKYLQHAKTHGDILIVGINSDRSVRTLKGERRPIVPEGIRAEVLAALQCVDYVVVFEEETPLQIIRELSPHVLVKGGDYRGKEVVGEGIVEGSGGKVVIAPEVEGWSTNFLIQTIVSRYTKSSCGEGK
jgi:D-beta-D-heptose 7-phosphate kinase/D-beta-D-heptose 1-phosphate adenosyltransferase